jgi:hypothetical protein
VFLGEVAQKPLRRGARPAAEHAFEVERAQVHGVGNLGQARLPGHVRFDEPDGFLDPLVIQGGLRRVVRGGCGGHGGVDHTGERGLVNTPQKYANVRAGDTRFLRFATAFSLSR